jgi:hypothetical protein
MRYEVGDRIIVVKDNKPVKARVVGHNTKLGRVSATLEKNGPIITYMVEDVFPLYRYGMRSIILGPDGVEADAQQIVPLFFAKPSDFIKQKDE